MVNYMRIATWNLQSDKKLTDEREALFRQAMTAVNADVWVITESWTNRCLLPDYSLVTQSCEAPDLESHRRWVAIWSRLDAQSLDVQGQPDRIACCRIKHSGKSMVVIGTVLPWPRDRLWPNSQGYCAALDIQAVEWRRLSAVFADCGLVVAGDFNQSLPHVRYYGSKQNETALNEVMESLELSCSTLGNDPLTNVPRIDHISIRHNGIRSPVNQQAGTWIVPRIRNKKTTDHSGSYVDITVPQ